MKTFVVGAGGGGIASALLAALRDETVTLVDSHSELGGCASFFKRGPFVFDVGATTISGIAEHEPLGKLFKLLGSRPELVPADPGLVIHLSCGKKLFYYRDFEKWMEELERHFPHLDHRPFWEKIKKLNTEGWKLLGEMSAFPDFTRIRHVGLLPNLFFSVDHALKKCWLDDPEYREMIDGILIISAQTKAPRTPFLVGAMALAYPAETYAPVGGMKGLMNFFERELLSLGVEIRKNERVTSLSDVNADRIVLNLPIWNQAELLGSGRMQKEAKQNPGTWGAFTLYFGCESSVKEPYHQVHLNHPDIPNYFVSFSLVGDKRAPENYQTVSISVHVDAKSWFEMSREEYQEQKNKLAEIILADFKERFKVQEVKFLTLGTPKTFEDYTGRKFGFVGGIPFTYGKNPFSLLGPLTEFKGIYRTGDTIFPGQGLCGVVAGAFQLDKYLKKES